MNANNTDPQPEMQGLSLKGLEKRYGSTQAVAGVTFDVHSGEVVALLGPSGSGKSTLLYLIAGLEQPDAGDILWNGASLAEVPPHRRGFGLMFQDFVLFPHRNVYANVAFGLEMAGLPPTQIAPRVEDVLELVGLPGFGSRDVNTLSGGEQQRIALARSLAPWPRLLMLDEPLGALDRRLRERLVVDLRAILRRSRQTALYVTHDQEEAFALADRVIILNAGRIEQSGPPAEVYRHPVSVFVARFLGLNNLLPAQVRQPARDPSKKTTAEPGLLVETPIGTFPAPASLQADQIGSPVTILLRPEEIYPDNAHGPCQIAGTLEEVTFRGSTCRAVVQVNGIPLQFDFPSSLDLPNPGETIQLSFDPQEALQVLPDGE